MLSLYRMIRRRTLFSLLGGSLVAALAMSLPSPLLAAGKPPLEGPLEGNFTLLDEPVPAPNTTIAGEFGEAVSLADFAGQVVLVNFWATWCAPCVREMPSLDRLQAKLGEEGLKVIAVSIDRGGVDTVLPFYQQHSLKNLAIYLDPKGILAQEFGLRGMPSSFLLDRKGRLVGGIEGALEWDSPEAVALFRFYLDGRDGET